MTKNQIHRRLTDEQVRTIFNKYANQECKAKDARTYLEVSKSRFYQLAQSYRDNPANFSIQYQRTRPTRKLDSDAEKNILNELKIEKEKIIDNPDVPTKHYNYSYIQGLLKDKYQQKISLPTIIERARANGYYQAKPAKKVHDREVLTNFAGELIQHDSSHHLFAPDAKEKWYLITSLDDYSRTLLYADFWLRETSFYHILALQSVFLTYGLPLSYYADQHRIFRYVKTRDRQSPWTTYGKFTDDVDPQWKQVLLDCGVKPIYALSPQAKGKVERPYQWLQDHLVRTCVRRNITSITEGRKILQEEVAQYNFKRIHSTTGEIPMSRFNQALKVEKSLFREFSLKPPFQSAKDIFCLRAWRVVDAYRKVSFGNLAITVPNGLPKEKVELRLYPDLKTGLTDVRFWSHNLFKGTVKVKTKDLSIVQF